MPRRRPRRGTQHGGWWRRAGLALLALGLAAGAWRTAVGVTPAAGYAPGRTEFRMAMLLLQSADTYDFAVRNPFALPLLAGSTHRPPELDFVNPMALTAAADSGLSDHSWYPPLGTALTPRMPAYWVLRADPGQAPPDLTLYDLLILDEGRPVDLALLGAMRPALEAFVRNGGVLWISNWGETTITNGGRNLSVAIRRLLGTAPGTPATAEPKRPFVPQHPLLWGDTLVTGPEVEALGQGVAEATWFGINPDGYVSDRLPDAQEQPVVVTDHFDQTDGNWRQVEVVSAARVGDGAVVITAGNVLGRVQDWLLTGYLGIEPDKAPPALDAADFMQLPPVEVSGAFKFFYNLVSWSADWREQGGGLRRAQDHGRLLPAPLVTDWQFPSELGESVPAPFTAPPVGAEGLVFAGDQSGSVYAFQSPPQERLPPQATAGGPLHAGDSPLGGTGVLAGYPYDLLWRAGGTGEVRGLAVARIDGALLLYAVHAFPDGFGSVTCHNALTGSQVWQFPSGSATVDRRTSGTPRAAPAVVDRTVLFTTHQPPPQAGGAPSGQSHLFLLDALTGRMNGVLPLGGRGQIGVSSAPLVTWRPERDQRGVSAAVPYFAYAGNTPSTMVGNTSRIWGHPLTLEAQVPDFNGDLNAVRLRIAADAYNVEVSPLAATTGVGRIADLNATTGALLRERFLETFLVDRIAPDRLRLTVADLEMLRYAPYPAPPPQGVGSGYTVRYLDSVGGERTAGNVVFASPPPPLALGTRVDSGAFGLASPATDGELLLVPADAQLPDVTLAQRTAQTGTVSATRLVAHDTPALLWQFAGLLRPPEAQGTPVTESWLSSFQFTPAVGRDAIFVGANYEAVWDTRQNRPGVTALSRRGSVYAVKRVPERCVFLPGGIRPGAPLTVSVDGIALSGPLSPGASPDYSVVFETGAVCLSPSGVGTWHGRTASILYTRNDNGSENTVTVTFPLMVHWRWTDPQLRVATSPVLTATDVYVGAWDFNTGETWVVALDRRTGVERQRYRLGVAGALTLGVAPLTGMAVVDGRLIVGTGLQPVTGANGLVALANPEVWVADGARLLCVWGRGYGEQVSGSFAVRAVPAPRQVIDSAAEPHASLRFTLGGARPLLTPNFYQPLERPTRVRLLDRDRMLVLDTEANRVLELDRAGRVHWQFPHPDGAVTPHHLLLSAPTDAVRFRRAGRLSSSIVLERGSDGLSEVLRVSDAAQFVAGMPVWAEQVLPSRVAPLGTLWQAGGDAADTWRVTAPLPDWVAPGVRLFVPGIIESTLIADAGNFRVLLVERPVVEGRMHREWAFDDGGALVRPQFLDVVSVIADHSTRLAADHPQLPNTPIGLVTGRPMYAALAPLEFNSGGELVSFIAGVANHPTDPTGRDPYLSVVTVARSGPLDSPWRIQRADAVGRLNFWPTRTIGGVDIRTPIQLLRQVSIVPYRGQSFLLLVDRDGVKLVGLNTGRLEFEYSQDNLAFSQPNDYLADLSGLPPLPTETQPYQLLAEFRPLAAQLTLTGSLLMANGTPIPVVAGEPGDLTTGRKQEVIEVFFAQERTTRLRRLDLDPAIDRSWFHWFLLPNPYDPAYPSIGGGTFGLTQPVWVERR